MCIVDGSNGQQKYCLKKTGFGTSRSRTDKEDFSVRRIVLAHLTVSAAGIRAAFDTIVTKRTVIKRLLQGQFQARCSVAGIPLTPNHCRL